MSAAHAIWAISQIMPNLYIYTYFTGGNSRIFAYFLWLPWGACFWRDTNFVHLHFYMLPYLKRQGSNIYIYELVILYINNFMCVWMYTLSASRPYAYAYIYIYNYIHILSLHRVHTQIYIFIHTHIYIYKGWPSIIQEYEYIYIYK